METPRASALAHVRALLGVVGALRAGTVDGVLAAVAEAMAGPMRFRTVVVNLYRPAWDDLEVVLVRGDEAAREALLGTRTSLEAWQALLDPRYDLGGAFFLPHDQHDWAHDDVATYVPAGEAPDHPDGWHPEDALLLPLRSTDDALLGIISLDEPADGRRPGEDDLDVLVAVAAHAAVAFEQAQVVADAEREHVALEGLLAVSAQLAGLAHPDDILRGVCAGVRDALGFARVCVALADGHGVLRPAASVGWSEDELTSLRPIELAALGPLIDPVLEREGCILASREQAMSRLPAELHDFFPSTANGRGRRAWDRHWLVVPLLDAGATLRGVLWPDDPADRLLPSAARLKALRAFANQALSAVESAQQADQRHVAQLDAVTGLRNRRDFHEGVARSIVRASGRAWSSGVAMVVCGLDDFERLEEAGGGDAADRVLRRFAELLRDATRGGDALTRLGGGEFAALLADTDVHGALAAAERLRTRVRHELASSLPVTVTVSIGVADSGGPSGRRTAHELVGAAARARDAARDGGGDRTVADAGAAGERKSPPGSLGPERRRPVMDHH